MKIVIKLAPPHPGIISRIDTNRKHKCPEVEVTLAFRVDQGNDVCGLCCIFSTSLSVFQTTALVVESLVKDEMGKTSEKGVIS
jgi:hypothetical protein